MVSGYADILDPENWGTSCSAPTSVQHPTRPLIPRVKGVNLACQRAFSGKMFNEDPLTSELDKIESRFKVVFSQAVPAPLPHCLSTAPQCFPSGTADEMRLEAGGSVWGEPFPVFGALAALQCVKGVLAEQTFLLATFITFVRLQGLSQLSCLGFAYPRCSRSVRISFGSVGAKQPSWPLRGCVGQSARLFIWFGK